MRDSIGEEPDCQNCKNPFLWQGNVEAWKFYGLIANQFCYDFHALPLIFQVYKPQMTRQHAMLFLEKLITIHSIMSRREEDGDK